MLIALCIFQCSALLQEDSREDFLEELSDDYVDIREEYNVKVGNGRVIRFDDSSHDSLLKSDDCPDLRT